MENEIDKNVLREEDISLDREKELLARMAGTIVVIVVCLAAMGFSAFAYFSHSISSGMNVIQSAHFDVVVTLVDVRDVTERVTADDTGELNADEGGEAEENVGGPNGADTEAVGGSTSGTSGMVLKGNSLNNCEDKVYTFQIKASGDAQTGYCKIVIKKDGSEQVYYTTQLYLYPDGDKGQKSDLTIEIDMTNGKGYSIEFIPQWGTSSYYAVEQVNLLNDNGEISFTPVASTDEEMAGSDEGVAGDGDGSQTENETETEPEPGVKEYYTVVKDDTLQNIAKLYGLTLNELYEFNKNEIENQDILKIGQVLKIPVSKEEAEETAETATEATTEAATEAVAEPVGEVAS